MPLDFALPRAPAMRLVQQLQHLEAAAHVRCGDVQDAPRQARLGSCGACSGAVTFKPRFVNGDGPSHFGLTRVDPRVSRTSAHLSLRHHNAHTLRPRISPPRVDVRDSARTVPTGLTLSLLTTCTWSSLLPLGVGPRSSIHVFPYRPNYYRICNSHFGEFDRTARTSPQSMARILWLLGHY